MGGGGSSDANVLPPAGTGPSLSSFSPTSGPVGTSVTLTGTNLADTTAVSFNSTPAATFQSVSATQVTAEVPTGASSGSISLTTPQGTATSATSFTVTLVAAECPVTTPAETFTATDAPVTQTLDSLDLVTPWGYGRAANASRTYPLVVNGCWGEGNLFPTATRQEYPSFYLDFNNYSTEEHGAWLGDLIDQALQAGYRIDPNRIYLTGFSQGGSGSFKLVRGMLTKGKLFAGIIRVAGQSESQLATAAVGKSALWYHIGLSDTADRVQVARTTYANLKAAYAQAVESTTTDTLTGHNRTTKTLTLNGIAIVKYSEYEGMGHDPSPCYRDPALFDWLFSQSLACR
ncbi:IPT/TIG domain-containing protein [Holophaga foetida]|uniref:IPT/TIG domain-containing protein n=1 Tax=Holophaga foetida TaxID=35839 RepID=UPI0002471C92|nr:IPT/TIG domain-containing protein [Holophaga foetida]